MQIHFDFSYYASSQDNCEDPYRACIGCDHSPTQSYYNPYGTAYPLGYDAYGSSLERLTGETYERTAPSGRVICGPRRRRCMLRIDRAAQFRNVRYTAANRFMIREQYISREEADDFEFAPQGY